MKERSELNNVKPNQPRYIIRNIYILEEMILKKKKEKKDGNNFPQSRMDALKPDRQTNDISC